MATIDAGKIYSLSLVLGAFVVVLTATFQTVSGAAAICPGPDPCRVEQTTGCSDFLETHELDGDCCALSEDPTTGNCVVTISNGTCGIYSTLEDPPGCEPGCTCDADGNIEGCVPPGTQWTAVSEQPCPQSEWLPPDTTASATDAAATDTPSMASMVPASAPTDPASLGVSVGASTLFAVGQSLISVFLLSIYHS